MSRWVRSTDVVWRRTARGVVVRPTEADSFLVLEASAHVLWELLDEARTLSDVVEAVADTYDTTPSVVATDIEGALLRLEEAGVVRREPS